MQWPAVNLFDFSTFSFSFMSALDTKARLCVLSHSVTSDSLDWSPPGPSVLGLSQARILEQVAISFSRGSSWPRGSNPHLLCFQHCRQILYLLNHQRSPVLGYFASNIPRRSLCGGERHRLHRCTSAAAPEWWRQTPVAGCPRRRYVPSDKAILFPGRPTSTDGSARDYNKKKKKRTRNKTLYLMLNQCNSKDPF